MCSFILKGFVVVLPQISQDIETPYFEVTSVEDLKLTGLSFADSDDLLWDSKCSSSSNVALVWKAHTSQMKFSADRLVELLNRFGFFDVSFVVVPILTVKSSNLSWSES